MTPGRLTAPTPLTAKHETATFDCGIDALDDWLKKRALRNEAAGASRTYVVCDGTVVIGYYCLATGAIARDEAPKPMQRNMPDPVPVIVLGRLAVDRRYQQQGLGSGMLRDAVLRTLRVADEVGVKAILVHAISDEAKAYYLGKGFLESPVSPMTVCLLLGTARQAFAEARP